MIRNFANIPCPKCEKDTLHNTMRCIECGNVQQTAGEAWKVRKKLRYFRRLNSGLSPRVAAAATHDYQVIDAAHRRKLYAGLKQFEKARIK